MPIYLVDHLPEHELDTLTRSKFRLAENHHKRGESSAWLIVTLVFIFGFIFGSSIHDFLFHQVTR